MIESRIIQPLEPGNGQMATSYSQELLEILSRAFEKLDPTLGLGFPDLPQTGDTESVVVPE